MTDIRDPHPVLRRRLLSPKAMSLAKLPLHGAELSLDSCDPASHDFHACADARTCRS
ncbi:MAG TPA: hypothetical protein VGI70_07565 [Polyangiales bacterium]|jgi:hypothetical protein